jgi:hypothetical protein
VSGARLTPVESFVRLDDVTRHLPLLLVFAAIGCVPPDLQAELDRARIERDQARLEAEQARLDAEKAMLEAERMRLAAEQQLGAQPACTPAPAPAAAEPKATVVQGRIQFSGKSTIVSVHVAGMGIDETFESDRKGQVAVLLPVGHYQLRLEAQGYRDKVLTLDVPELPEGQRFDFAARLQKGQ